MKKSWLIRFSDTQFANFYDFAIINNYIIIPATNKFQKYNLITLS